MDAAGIQLAGEVDEILQREFSSLESSMEAIAGCGELTMPSRLIRGSPRNAAAQATRYGYPIQIELQLLLVHGCLHLLGYDHDTDEAQAAMWAAQGAILTSLGVTQDFTQRMAAE